MTIRHFALVGDYFDDTARLRVFVCDECGTLVANDLIEVHEDWHLKYPPGLP